LDCITSDRFVVYGESYTPTIDNEMVNW